MSGIRIAVQTTPELLLTHAGQAAESLAFTVGSAGPQTLQLRKGSLGLSIFLGAFIAYCDFRATVQVLGNGLSQLTLERNKPWWTGVIGVSRVKGKAAELVDVLQRGLASQGLNVAGREEF